MSKKFFEKLILVHIQEQVNNNGSYNDEKSHKS